MMGSKATCTRQFGPIHPFSHEQIPELHDPCLGPPQASFVLPFAPFLHTPFPTAIGFNGFAYGLRILKYDKWKSEQFLEEALIYYILHVRIIEEFTRDVDRKSVV